MTRTALVTGAAAIAAALLAGCGSDSGTGTVAPATTTPQPANLAGLDSCLVGVWKSTGVSGRINIVGTEVTLSGGAGEVLTIGADGSIRTDETSAAPIGGPAPGGVDYRLSQTGIATGTVTSAANRIEVTIHQPTQLLVTLYKNGNLVESQHPGSANDTYTCTPHTSLVITGAGGTVTRYAPS